MNPFWIEKMKDMTFLRCIILLVGVKCLFAYGMYNGNWYWTFIFNKIKIIVFEKSGMWVLYCIIHSIWWLNRNGVQFGTSYMVFEKQYFVE